MIILFTNEVELLQSKQRFQFAIIHTNLFVEPFELILN